MLFDTYLSVYHKTLWVYDIRKILTHRYIPLLLLQCYNNDIKRLAKIFRQIKFMCFKPKGQFFMGWFKLCIHSFLIASGIHTVPAMLSQIDPVKAMKTVRVFAVLIHSSKR